MRNVLLPLVLALVAGGARAAANVDMFASPAGAESLLGGGKPVLTGADRRPFTVVGMPDTQNYSEFYPSIYRAQTEWIVANKNASNIRFVSHYGDVVNDGGDTTQWSNARQAMDVLDRGGIPYGVVAGNHDITPNGTAGTPYIPEQYLANFGPQRYSGRDWYGGSSPSGMSNFQFFHGGGRTFIALHLLCDTPVAELEWAQGVLAMHRDKPAMVTTHRYLQDAEDYTGGVPLVSSGRYPSIWYGVEGTYAPGGIQSEEFYDSFIRRNKNVFMVNCGHFHEEYRQTSTNAYGLPVHEVLADYQDDPNGGDGWMRLMQFDVDRNRIDVESYSPTLSSFRSAAESRFSLAVDFERHAPTDRTTVSFQNGINGYQGTRDTWINQASPNASYGESPSFEVDDDTGNSIFTDNRGQALLRFEGVIGSGPMQVPLGAQITSATLRLQVSDDVDFIYDADFFVHAMVRNWNESSTWNSLGNGLQSGTDYGLLLGTLEGDNNPDGDGLRHLDVTALVQQWANGVPNFGFAIIPEIISGNDDGVTVLASESGNALFRPYLEVSYLLSAGLVTLVPAPGAVGALALLAMGSGLRRRRGAAQRRG